MDHPFKAVLLPPPQPTLSIDLRPTLYYSLMPERVRPGDLLRPPLSSSDMTSTKADLSKALSALPDSWKTAIDKADEWPFVNPDEAMDQRDPSFSDFPNDDSALPDGVVPFSEFEPWGRMDEETDRDYELFSYYRSLGLSRTQSETARHFGITQVYVNRVANNRNWIERVKAWDDYRERIYTTEVIEGVKKMARDHAEIASKGIKSLSVAFDALLQRILDPETGEVLWDEMELSELSVRSLFALAEKSARAIPNLMNAERLSRGLPTEISSQVVVSESKVTVTTSDELAEIVFGLQNVLPIPEKEPDSGEIIDVEGEEVA